MTKIQKGNYKFLYFFKEKNVMNFIFNTFQKIKNSGDEFSKLI